MACPGGICGPDRVIGKPGAIGINDIEIDYKPRTCAEMDALARTKVGKMNPDKCALWKFAATIKCDCRALTPKPTTRKPTHKPNRKRTKKNLRRLSGRVP